jgi:alpha-galactosidase
MALPKFVCLCSAGVEVCIDLSAGTPNVLHWGRSIGKNSAEALEVSQLDPAPHCDFDEPQVIGIWRENARGFLGRPTIIGSRNGADFSQLFALADVIETRQAC